MTCWTFYTRIQTRSGKNQKDFNAVKNLIPFRLEATARRLEEKLTASVSANPSCPHFCEQRKCPRITKIFGVQFCLDWYFKKKKNFAFFMNAFSNYIFMSYIYINQIATVYLSTKTLEIAIQKGS